VEQSQDLYAFGTDVREHKERKNRKLEVARAVETTSFCTRETAEPFKLRRCSRQLFAQAQLQETTQTKSAIVLGLQEQSPTCSSLDADKGRKEPVDKLKDVFLALFGGDREEIGVLEEDEERGSLALGRWRHLRQIRGSSVYLLYYF